MGACIRKRVVYDISCKRFQFFVNVEALPTTMSVLETPLQGPLNHWGRILPQGPTIQNNQLKKRVCVKILDFDL